MHDCGLLEVGAGITSIGHQRKSEMDAIFQAPYQAMPRNFGNTYENH